MKTRKDCLMLHVANKRKHFAIYSKHSDVCNLGPPSKKTILPKPYLIVERAVRHLPDSSGFPLTKEEESMLSSRSEVDSPENATGFIMT